MRDEALEIVRGIYRDVSDRKGMLDDIDDEILNQILNAWYAVAQRVLNPGADVPEFQLALLSRVRG